MFGGSNCVALLAADVSVDHDVTTDLSMGADDALRVYLNGKVVYSDQIQRGISPDSIRPTVTFLKGVNHLVVMVEQGGGGWAVQFRIIGGTTLAEVAASVKNAITPVKDRAGSVNALVSAANILNREGHNGQAASLVRTVHACYPDVPDAQTDLAWRFQDVAAQTGDGMLNMDLEDWMESSAPALDPGHDPNRIIQEWRCSELEQGWCREDRALDLLQFTLRTYFRADWQAETLRRLGELYRINGFNRLATTTYNKALSLGQGDGGWIGTVQNELMRARPPKGQHGASDTSFEVNNQLRMAERALSAKDVEHAIAGLQSAIENSGSMLCLTADGHVRSVAAYAASCLRSMDADGQAAYASRYEGRAQSLLAQAEARQDAAGFERLAGTFPLTHSATKALAKAADLYAARGAWGMAAGTWLALLQQHPLQEAEGVLVAERLADCASRAGDHRALVIAAAALKDVAGQVPVDGAMVDVHAWIQGLLAGPPPAASPAGWALPEKLTAATIASYPCMPEDLYDMSRIGWMDGPQPVYAPCVAGDSLAITNFAGLRLFDLPGQRMLWRSSAEFPQLRNPTRWGNFMGTPECQACIAGHTVLGRVVRGGVCEIEAHDLASGSLIWSTEGGEMSSPGTSASSSPAALDDRVFACYLIDGQSALVALDLHDGHVLWKTVLSARRPGLVAMGGSEIGLDGYLAPPLVLGREVFVALDTGSLLAVDAGSGLIEWSALYHRNTYDPNDGGGPLAVAS